MLYRPSLLCLEKKGKRTHENMHVSFCIFHAETFRHFVHAACAAGLTLFLLAACIGGRHGEQTWACHADMHFCAWDRAWTGTAAGSETVNRHWCETDIGGVTWWWW